MIERTFVMIKPDGVAKGLSDEIIARIQKSGLKVVSKRRVRMDRKTAERLYDVHKGKEFFERLVNFIISGEVFVMVVEGERAISRIRELMGPTDPAKAPKGTIRGDFAASMSENIIHASDSPESVKREMPIFF